MIRFTGQKGSEDLVEKVVGLVRELRRVMDLRVGLDQQEHVLAESLFDGIRLNDRLRCVRGITNPTTRGLRITKSNMKRVEGKISGTPCSGTR